MQNCTSLSQPISEWHVEKSVPYVDVLASYLSELFPRTTEEAQTSGTLTSIGTS